MAVSAEKFEKIAKIVGDPNTPAARPSSRAEKLHLYGLYKRATVESDQRPARPGMFNIDGRMKWDAWAAEDGKSKEEAMQAYVDLANELVGQPVEDVLTE